MPVCALRCAGPPPGACVRIQPTASRRRDSRPCEIQHRAVAELGAARRRRHSNRRPVRPAVRRAVCSTLPTHGAYNASCETKRRATSLLAAIERSSQRMLHRVQRVTRAASEPAAIHAVVALGVTDGRLDRLAPLGAGEQPVLRLGVQRGLDQLRHGFVVDRARLTRTHIVVQPGDASLDEPRAPLLTVTHCSHPTWELERPHRSATAHAQGCHSRSRTHCDHRSAGGLGSQ